MYNVKKLMLLGAVISVGSAIAAENVIEAVAFKNYRILSQGPFVDGTDATYVVTANPPLAIRIPAKGPEIVKLISGGSMKNCELATHEEQRDVEIDAAKLMGIINQADMAVAAGYRMNEKKRERLEGIRNWVAFVNESVGLSMYTCPIPAQDVKSH